MIHTYLLNDLLANVFVMFLIGMTLFVFCVYDYIVISYIYEPL